MFVRAYLRASTTEQDASQEAQSDHAPTPLPRHEKAPPGATPHAVNRSAMPA